MRLAPEPDPRIPAGRLTALALAALLGLAGCPPAAGGRAGDGGHGAGADGGRIDAGTADAGVVDAGTPDGGADGGIADGGSADAGTADGGLACNLGDPPIACGTPGSACAQACLGNGALGPCQPPSGPIDIATDPNNCGECGHACPAMVHAPPACANAACTHGPCDPGWYDLDGPTGPGCAWQCANGECTGPGGQVVPIDTPPLPSSGLVFQGPVSSSSWGAGTQTSTDYTNVGALGEPTPPGVGNATRQTSTSYINIGGLDAVEPP